MVLYVSCADDYILNIRQRLILIAPEIVAPVVLGGLWLRSAIPGAGTSANAMVAIAAVPFTRFSRRYACHYILCVHLYKFYLW